MYLQNHPSPARPQIEFGTGIYTRAQTYSPVKIGVTARSLHIVQINKKNAIYTYQSHKYRLKENKYKTDSCNLAPRHF